MFRKTLLASATLAALASPMLLSTPAAADYQQGTIAYQEGRYTTAYIQFKQSADGGDGASQYMLGRLYQEGRGVDRDFVQAYAWYDLAAINGYGPAASARDRLVSQLSASQLQTATTLSSRWRNDTASSDSGSSNSAASTPSYVPPYSVRNVQQALKNLGYAVGSIDGEMGPNTRGAIRAYQIDSGLPVSGEPSLSLHEHLQQALRGENQTAESDTSGPGPELVSEVQAELRVRGYDIPSINGRLDAATVNAIERYQRDASLAVTGKVNDQLLAQLRSGREDPAEAYRAQVRAVQQALNARGYDAGPVDGAFGPSTRGAIRAYQVANGQAADGQIDAELLADLGIDSAVVGDGGQDSGGSPNAQLIAAVEGRLIELNYAAGSVDGVLDQQARAAIAAYQRNSGMTVTGEVSEALLRDLRNSSQSNNSDQVNQAIWRVENDLDLLGYRVGPIDGTLDNETRAGIEDFQRNAGLPVTGRPTQEVLSGLASGEQDTGGDGGQQAANYLSPEQTWEVEKRLQDRGYNVGTLDTRADAQTHAAVRAYQRDQGVAVDGELDQALLAQLQQGDAKTRSWDDLTDMEKGLTIMKGITDTIGPALQND